MKYVDDSSDYYILTDIIDGLKANFPGDDMKEPVSNIMEAIKQAPPVDKILMNISATEQDLYYAFLKEELNGENYYNKDESQELILDFKIAHKMLDKDMEYLTILQAMAYSPRLATLGDDMEKRWNDAVLNVSAIINPILTVADYVAKPLTSIKLYKDEPDVIYMSCLKAVLHKKSNLFLREADEEVVRLLHDAGCNDKRYILEIMGHSIRFIPPYITDYTDGKQFNEDLALYNKAINSFVDNALEKIQTQESSLNHKPTDDEIYQEMNQKIRAMKEQHEKGDRFSYWTTSIHIIKDTMEKLQKMQNLSKTLNIWTVGLERAAIELELDTKPQEYAELKTKIHNLIDASKEVIARQEINDMVWLIAAKLETYSQDIMKQIHEKQQNNPLLQLPEVQHAPDFAVIADSRSPSPEALYFSCLKEVVKEKPGIRQDQADNIVIDKLFKCGKDEEDIVLALSCSPCLSNLTKVQAMGAAQSMVDNKTTAKQPQIRGDDFSR